MKPAFLILMIVMNCFWAGTYSAFKALAPHLDPGQIATLRYGLSALLLVCAWPWLPGAAPRGRDLIRTALMGIMVFVLAPRLQVAGVQRGQATDAAVLMALEPLVTSVAAALFLREHIGPRRWIGFTLGLAGVVVMAEVWHPEFQLPGLVANAIFVASFICEAAYSVMGKPLIARASLGKIVAIALLAGSLVNVLLNGPDTLRAAAVMPPLAWLLMAYLVVVCTVIGYVVWFVVIRETEVNVTVLTVFLQPVIGLVIALVTLDESLRWSQLWGSLVIVVGLVIGLSRQIRRAQKKEDASPPPENP